MTRRRRSIGLTAGQVESAASSRGLEPRTVPAEPSASSAMPVNITEPVTDDFLANQHPPGLQVEGGNNVKGSGFADNVASFHRARSRTIKHASC